MHPNMHARGSVSLALQILVVCLAGCSGEDAPAPAARDAPVAGSTGGVLAATSGSAAGMGGSPGANGTSAGASGTAVPSGAGVSGSGTPSSAGDSGAGAAAAGAPAETEPDPAAFGCSGALPVMQALDLSTLMHVEPDWSCYPQPGALPAAQAPVAGSGGAMGRKSVEFRLTTLLPVMLDGVSVDLFLGATTLGMPLATRTVETGMDSVSFEVPVDTRLVSVRVQALTRSDSLQSVAETRQYGFPLLPGDTEIEGYIFLRDQQALVATQALAGGQADPTKAMLSSAARDCRDRYVRGAQFELIDVATGTPVSTDAAAEGPRAAYVMNALPTTDCTFTAGELASWVLVNAPVNVSGDMKQRGYRLRMKGRMRASDAEPVVLGERDVELFAGSISFVRAHRVTGE